MTNLVINQKKSQEGINEYCTVSDRVTMGR